MARLFLGIRKPRRKILGMEIAGIVELCGKEVKKFQVGDKVFASTVKSNFGGYAEFKCLPEDGIITKMSNNMTFEDACTIPNGAYTALEIIKNINIKRGQAILVYGASGSVGSFAIQFAKNLGAIVTASCSANSIEMMKELGIEKILDYTKTDFDNFHNSFDVVFDAVGLLSKTSALKLLKPNGKYFNVHTASDGIKGKHNQVISELRDLYEQGQFKTYLDKIYNFEDLIEAHKYVDTGHKKGNVVIRVVDV